MPSAQTRPESTGVASAICAPAASASLRSAVIRAWLSMIPVEGDKSPRTQETSGSSSRISARESETRSVTPFASAFALSRPRVEPSSSEVATMSLPRRE